MVKSVVLACVFDGHYIPDILDNADNRLVALRVRANIAEIVIGNIMAGCAPFYFCTKCQDRPAEGFDDLYVLADEVKGQAQRSFPADSRKPGQLIYRIFK